MYAYLIRRIFLIIPTILGIMIINFAIVQFVPGGPVEQMIAQLTGQGIEVTAKVGGAAGKEIRTDNAGASASIKNSGLSSRYRGAQGLPPELISDIEKQFGLDKPALERFIFMIGN